MLIDYDVKASSDSFFPPPRASCGVRYGLPEVIFERGAKYHGSVTVLTCALHGRCSVPPARRTRSMTHGDNQNSRVGPDPTVGPNTVAGAARRCGCGLARFGLGSVF